MKTINKILLAGVVVMLPFTVMAVDAKKDTKAAGGHHLRIDTDKDGKISKAEFMAGPEKAFVKMDVNKDGFLSQDEMKAGSKRGGKGKKADAKPAAKAN